MPSLFETLALRSVLSRNRVVISPMCTYAAQDGCATDWHLVHLGKFALGGAGIVFAEATAVEECGRISHTDLGLWNDAQIAPLARVAAFLKTHGAVPAIQLSHAGRRASGTAPWDGPRALNEADRARNEPPWPVVGPSAVAAAGGWPVPQELSPAEIGAVIQSWQEAAHRADAAGFDILEIHGGHGYLVHQFLSPVSNRRTDRYGGERAGRMRFAIELADAVRAAWPAEKPLFFRVSAVDGSESWTLDDTVALAAELRGHGVDVIDCSSGGIGAPSSTFAVPRGFGFQVPFAERVRSETGLLTMAVGLIIDPFLAGSIIREGRADLVAIAREALANPNWPHHAEAALNGADFERWPLPYAGWLTRRAMTIAEMTADLS